MTPIRMAQYGTKHGHAAGKLAAMLTTRRSRSSASMNRTRHAGPTVAETEPYRHVRWLSKDEMLDDASIVAIASEGLNSQSLGQSEEIVAAGKHVWYDKPAGDNWAQYQRLWRRFASTASISRWAICSAITTASGRWPTGPSRGCWAICFRCGRTCPR